MAMVLICICAVTFAITFQNSQFNKKEKYRKHLEVISGISFTIFLIYALTLLFVDYEEVKEKVSEEDIVKVEGNYVSGTGEQTSYFEKVDDNIEQKVIPSDLVKISEGKIGEEVITTYIIKPKSKLLRVFNWGLVGEKYEYVIKIPLEGE